LSDQGSAEFNQYQYRIVTIEELDYVEHADKYLETQKNRYVHEVKLSHNDCYFSKSSIRYAISLVLSSAMDKSEISASNNRHTC
jgi:hypothetical protein